MSQEPTSFENMVRQAIKPHGKTYEDIYEVLECSQPAQIPVDLKGCRTFAILFTDGTYMIIGAVIEADIPKSHTKH